MYLSKFALASLVVACLCQFTFAQEEKQLSGVFYMQYATVKQSGNDLMLAMMAREGAPKQQEQTYTVQIPVRDDKGVVTMRTEQRTRMVNVAPLVKKVVKLEATSKFETVDGKEIPREKISPQFKKARQVIVLQGEMKIPESAKSLLREDSIVLRANVFVAQ